jgi:hypothetical protein
MISEALLNLLINRPSAIADPRLPPPIMAIFLLRRKEPDNLRCVPNPESQIIP